MPRKAHWSNGGAVGAVITPLMIRYLLCAREQRDSQLASDALGIDRDALMSMIRYVEIKTKARLFIRRLGRSCTQLAPSPDASRFFEWCSANPAGGDGWRAL